MSEFDIPKQAIKLTDSDSAVPTVIHTKMPHLPEPAVLESELRLSADNRLYHHIAALSDVHKKKDISNPTSSVAVSENYIMPQLFDSAPNCGMRLIATDISEEEIKKTGLDNLFRNLQSVTPTAALKGKTIPKDVTERSFIKGALPVAEYLNVRTKNEVGHSYMNGDLFTGLRSDFSLENAAELYEILSPLTVKLARHRLGILGATSSHFLYLVRVDEILDDDKAEAAGLRPSQYLFFMHTGSGIIGRLLGYLYSPQKRSSLQSAELQLLKFGYKNSEYKRVLNLMKDAEAAGQLVGFDINSTAGQMAVKTLLAAGNQGFANKTVLTDQLDRVLEKTLKRQVNLNLIYDAPHILLSREEHYGKPVWVHRNGATRAYGPAKMASHDVFSKTGEPLFLAALENTYTYLAFGTDDNESSFRSAPHELGKLKHIPKATFSEIKPTKNKLLEPVIRFTGKDRREILPRNKHAVFSERLAREMEENNILNLAAKLRPVAYLTHHHA